MTILCDTNVLLRHANTADPMHAVNQTALTHLQAKGWQVVVVLQIYYEFWAVATRPKKDNGLGYTVEQATSDLTWIQTNFTLLAETNGLLPLWITLVQTTPVTGKTAHDARLVAAMMLHEVEHILTFNVKDFKQFKSMVAIDPAHVQKVVP